MPADGSTWAVALEKSRKGLFERLAGLFKGSPVLDSRWFGEIEEILIEGDVGAALAASLMDDVRSEASRNRAMTADGARNTLKERLVRLLEVPQEPELPIRAKPHVVLVTGVNGTGKTTFIGKLAWRYRREGRKVLLAAADTFRAAAGEQLGVWAGRAGADWVGQARGSDPAAVAFDALDAAVARGVDVLLVDTAGRLHTKTNLMEELKKIRRTLSKKMTEAPHETLLVLDALTGQNGLNQARVFLEAGATTGAVLTKLDGTAKGGIVAAIRAQLGIPVKWIGVGEGVEDLIPFDARAFVDGLIG